MAWLFIFILSILGFALIIDYKRKKNNNNPAHNTHLQAKAEDSSNYIMGDNMIQMAACNVNRRAWNAEFQAAPKKIK